ncbi:MAG: monovalent cation/H+ antiporter subunit D family protein [Candidatus Latescibacterota bacterium]|nr:monovalent cation/H+ antiporter subunit D family protein [Candidatus Latescibacterota bacterium]
MSPDTLLLAAVFLPLASGPLIAITGASPNLRETVTVIAGVITFGFVLCISNLVNDGVQPAVTLMELVPGLSLQLKVEPLGMIFSLIASGLWIATSIYSVGYMRGHGESNQTRYYFFFAVAITAALGVAYAGNLLTLFVFYEVLTLSTYPLVTHERTEEAMRGGRVYMGILISTSVAFLLWAVIWTYHLAGTLDFVDGGILAGRADVPTLTFLLALFAFGTGKAALMPFHRWLPAAMVAPTPVSALLHAVAVVKAGVFSVMKIAVYVFGIDTLNSMGLSQWLQYVAGGTILISSLIAMTKDNLKARLAYSTVSQLSYIVLGAALANELGVLGGSLHIVTHAFGKITLFFCAGAIIVGAHKTEISDMRGLGRRMPFTFGAFLLGSLSIIGLPPFAGAWSKWYLLLAALDADQLILVGVLLVSSLLNIAYLLPVAVTGFFAPPEGEEGGLKEAPVACVLPLCFTAASCIILFFYLDPFLALARRIGG